VSDRASYLRLGGIRAYGRHGADPGERDRSQAFAIDVELEVDAEAARTSDDLKDAVDYARLHRRVVELVATTSFALLERLGDEIARDLLKNDRVISVRATVAKPGLLNGATAAVSVFCDRTR